MEQPGWSVLAPKLRRLIPAIPWPIYEMIKALDNYSEIMAFYSRK